MKNSIIKIFSMLIVLLVVLSGCSKESEYHIKPPKNSDFNFASVTDLNNSDIDLIKECMPKVVKWYNSIDITKPQSINFVTEEIKTPGDTLFKNEIYQTYLNNFTSGIEQTDKERAIFKQINMINAVYGQIAEIMMTNEINYTLVGEGENTITINKDSWAKLGDKIKEAIDFYYN